MLNGSYGEGFNRACVRYGVKLAAMPRFTPAAPVGDIGFLRGTQQHGKNLMSGLKGWLGNGPQQQTTVRGRAGGGGVRAQAGNDQALARQQVWNSAKGLAPAAAIGGLGAAGAYHLLRDDPRQNQQQMMY